MPFRTIYSLAPELGATPFGPTDDANPAVWAACIADGHLRQLRSHLLANHRAGGLEPNGLEPCDFGCGKCGHKWCNGGCTDPTH